MNLGACVVAGPTSSFAQAFWAEKRSKPRIGCAGAGKDPFWRAVGIAQKAAVAVACGAALPQRNRAGLSVSDHFRSWEPGGHTPSGGSTGTRHGKEDQEDSRQLFFRG